MQVPPEQLSPYPAGKVEATRAESKPRSQVHSPQQARGPPQTPDRILREPEVRKRVGLSHATIWRKVRNGDFPAPVRLGPQSVGWIEREIDAWIAERAARRPSKKQPPNENAAPGKRSGV
jgi:prophage regulatory protein